MAAVTDTVAVMVLLAVMVFDVVTVPVTVAIAVLVGVTVSDAVTVSVGVTVLVGEGDTVTEDVPDSETDCGEDFVVVSDVGCVSLAVRDLAAVSV